MKLNCGPSWAEKRARKEQWHTWFAWHPVRVGPRDCRWLEPVERKGEEHWCSAGFYWNWEYRPMEAEARK